MHVYVACFVFIEVITVDIALDVGALFSGADIVQWMMESLAGLETSEEAEKLGQLLLDQGAILHSEGSRYNVYKLIPYKA